MLVCKLNRAVDPPALLGDVKLDLELFLNKVIAEKKIYEMLRFWTIFFWILLLLNRLLLYSIRYLDLLHLFG